LITAYYLPFDSNYLSAFTILSSFIALLFCIISINIFVKQYEMNRHEVLIVNDMLEESVKMAKEKAAYAELLLREMNHRVKNNLQLISSLLNIQAQKVNSNIAKKALGDAKNRVHSIALIHERLYLDPDIQSVDVTDYLDSLIQNIKSSLPLGVTGSLNVESHSDHYRLPFRDAVSVGLILNEMITNAILHGLKNIADKEIRVEVLGRDEGRLRLNVKDNGMNLEKAMDPKNRGFGMELIETLAGNYNGKVFVNKKMNMLVVELQFEQEEETIAV
jgi:two-component sensor histidine kinase